MKLSKAETETKEKILKENAHILPNFLPYCTLNMTVAFHYLISIRSEKYCSQVQLGLLW